MSGDVIEAVLIPVFVGAILTGTAALAVLAAHAVVWFWFVTA